jgi:hypothetical protein
VEGATATLGLHAASWDLVDVVRVFADGRPVAEQAICDKQGDATVSVPLLPGVNRVSAIAFDANGFASNDATIDLEARGDLAKPDLWVLAVGVGDYRNLPERLRLHGPPGDASGVAALFRAMEGKAYAHVHVNQLVDAAATPAAIRDGVAWLAQMKPNDVGILFLAGHGLKQDEGSDMVFATAGFAVTPDGKSLDPASFTRDAVGWRDISEGVGRAKGRVLVLLDACHSGHFSQETVVENDDLAATLAQENRAGGVVFAASKGKQLSYEPDSARALVLDPGQARAVSFDSGSPHGFFTGAFLAAMADPASDHNGDGAIQLSEMIDEVERRVATASGSAQTPWVARRDLFGDFKLADAPR